MDKNLELRRLYTQSFDDSEAFVDYFFRKLTSPDKVVALIRDGKTVSALHLLDRRIFLRGELFEMPFVVAAATVRELRGMRLLETVMRSAFERLYSEGKMFVALYPFSHAYYRKYGFVTYTKISRKEIKYKKDGETEIMPCTPLNMLKIYNRFCAGRQGYIVRQADTYEELLERWSVDNLTACTVKRNRLEAYVVFSPLTGEIEEACGDTEVLDGVEELNGKTCPDFDGTVRIPVKIRIEGGFLGVASIASVLSNRGVGTTVSGEVVVKAGLAKKKYKIEDMDTGRFLRQFGIDPEDMLKGIAL